MKKVFLTGLLCLILAPCVTANGLIDDYVDIAGELAQSGKYEQALNYINKSLLIEPNNSKLLEMKYDLLKISGLGNSFIPPASTISGNTEFQQAEKARFNSEYAKSVVLYKNSLVNDANFAPAYLGLSISQYELKNFQEAKNNLNSYLTLMPKSDFAVTS